MNIVTGLCLGLLIMVMGSLGMLLFGVYLANRAKPRRAKEASIALTREEAQRLIDVIGQLQSLREKLNELDSTGTNGSSGIPK